MSAREYFGDLLERLDHNASLSLTLPGEIRARVLEEINHLLDTEGTFDYGRVRQGLPEWCHGPESGNAVNSLVASKQVTWTGAMAPLGNTKQRAGGRLVKVYRRTS